MLSIAYHDATRNSSRPQRATPEVPEENVAYLTLQRIETNSEAVATEMDGIWRIASYTLNGKPSNVEDAKASIADGKFVAHFPSMDKENQFGSVRYSVRGNDIDFLCQDRDEGKPFTLLGTWKREGDVLWIAFHDSVRRPTRPQRAVAPDPEKEVVYLKLVRIPQDSDDTETKLLDALSATKTKLFAAAEPSVASPSESQ